MAIFKCKMCGGDLSFQPGNSTGICDYCGAEQTLPKVVDENLQGLFNRANTLRMKAEFDKAAEIYEKILQASGTEAEAYWGLILCKYGIEYVEDPVTYKRVPTCHRASYDAVTADDDYKMALQYADVSQRMIYETEAKQIDEIQKGIIVLAQKEDPYDVFICYKETDENGQRTQDSVLANDIYYQLTQEGFKVFYAAITLEDKLGQEYEPYIFSALNSAKVMLVLGTKPEYFSAVWVKNEWSRFLKLMKKDRAKMMIPCYRDMDAYELPQEFAHLQAQNMEKIGFINDIVRGIKKITGRDEAVRENVSIQSIAPNSNIQALLDRGNMSLEDKEWEKADEFFEEVLNQDAKCAEAYLGKLLVKENCSDIQRLQSKYIQKYNSANPKKLQACYESKDYIEEVVEKYTIPKYLPKKEIRSLFSYDLCFLSEVDERKKQKQQQLNELENEKNLIRVRQYAQSPTKEKIEMMLENIRAKLDERITMAENSDRNKKEQVVGDYKKFLVEQTTKAEQMNRDAQQKRERWYQQCIENMTSTKSLEEYRNLKKEFDSMYEYKDAHSYSQKCQMEIQRINQENEEKAEQERIKRVKEENRKNKICTIIIVSGVTAALIIVLAWMFFFEPYGRYKEAEKMISAGREIEAFEIYNKLGNFMNSSEKKDRLKKKNVILALANAETGDVLSLGNYQGELKWIVKEVDEDKILLLSQNCIEYGRQYNSGGGSYWTGCTLRLWLNGEFKDTAFDNQTKKYIIESKLTNERGQDSVDSVFCLGVDDVTGKDGYNIATLPDGTPVNWWLRTESGTFGKQANCVKSDGTISDNVEQNDKNEAVRPAMWIKRID